MRKRIVILFYEKDKSSNYVIHYLAEIWREQGLEVHFNYDAETFLPADLAILHVDQSVVPKKYLHLAQRYPKVLNIYVTDIRKSSFSQILLGPRSDYQGKVIVKANYNYGGIPEVRNWKGPMMKLRKKIFGGGVLSKNYKIYDSRKDVPLWVFMHPNLVVEKFLPEQEGDLYYVRNYHFFGDSYTCCRMGSKEPVVTGTSQVVMEDIEVHPEIISLREEMKFDYGKFDYVVRDGKVHLLDANKTTGFGALKMTEHLKGLHKVRAKGIHYYL